MTIINKLTNLINRFRPRPPRTTSDELPSPRPISASLMRLRLDNDRRTVVQDSRRMYDSDTRVSEIIDTLARDLTKGGFEVEINSGPDRRQALQIVTDLIARLDLFARLDDWTRFSLRDGDSFLELSVDDQGLIQQVTRKPCLSMHRNSNQYDRFLDPTRAYWYSDRPWPVPSDDAIWFADWQIIHARWRHDEGSKYGRPLFARARQAYFRLDEGEHNIAIRRKTRAGKRYVHKLDTNDPNEVARYMEANRDTLDNPYAAIQDFFGNVDISSVEGDSNLGDILDIQHHLDTFGVASPVPLQLLGYGNELNRDILEQKLEQYERALEGETWVTSQLVKPLLEMQWLLLGIWPPTLDYSIKWASHRTLTPQTLRDVAAAGLSLRGLGWPDEIIIDILAPLIPGLDPEALKQALSRDKAARPDEIARMAATVAADDKQEEETPSQNGRTESTSLPYLRL